MKGYRFPNAIRPVILHALGSYTSPKRQRGPQRIPSLALRANVPSPANVSVLAAWTIVYGFRSVSVPLTRLKESSTPVDEKTHQRVLPSSLTHLFGRA